MLVPDRLDGIKARKAIMKDPRTYRALAVLSCAMLALAATSCKEEGSADCDPPCPDGQVCVGGACVEAGEYEAERQHCVDVINGYRSSIGKPALARSADLEACAAEGALYDSQHPSPPHAHFRSTGGCGGTAYGENEIPGWPLNMYGSIMATIDEGTAMMWGEGPGGGHYENITGDYTRVGCGIYVDTSEGVWVVQDYR
jgi:uncharacterized protein YkwD